MDAPFAGDAGDAPHETVMVSGSCTYVDYGSTCSASCDLPVDVPIYFLNPLPDAALPVSESDAGA